MARPRPIVVPALSQQIEGPGQAQLGQALGQLIAAFGGRALQRGQEAGEQEAFRGAFPGLFPTEQVEAAGPRLPAGGVEEVGIAPEGAELAPPPTAEVVPENIQALTRLLSTTPGGRALGQKVALQQTIPKPAKTGEPFLSPELIAELDLPEGTQITATQAQKIGAKLAPAAGEKLKTTDVQSAKILPGGLAFVVFDDGTTGLVESSEADAALIRQAERRGAELQGLRGAEREAGKKAIQVSTKAFDTIPSVKKNIANLEQGINLIDQGAETGVIARQFPSIKAASLELDNLQGQLGLDVVGATSFGALSESELAFAKDTALPTGLEGPELKDWLIRKRDAQRKALNNLTETAIFLGIPGNTISDFLTSKRQQQAAPQGIEQISDDELLRIVQGQ